MLAVCITPALAQPQMPRPVRPIAAISQQQSGELTRFNLDFLGGTPKELVAAIQKAMEKPLNAIVPEEDADINIPPLKMSNVNVGNLFSALEEASRQTHTYETGRLDRYRTVQQMVSSYGFRQGPGPLTDDTIWYFHAEKPPMLLPSGTGEGKTVRFYSLDPYLRVKHGERTLTVDDITTAIETGWKMLGETSPPRISFHKDTNLLIAVGETNKLDIIDAVLRALEPVVRLEPTAASAAPGKAAAPKAAEPPRSAESSNAGSE